MSTIRPTIKKIARGPGVAIVSDPRAATVTALVLVHVGSAFESKKEHGLSHFLEHMCFKGTQRRPSAKMLAEEIEALGAVTNAFTDREFTGYYIKGNPAHIERFTEILADIYQHGTFPAQEIEKEKGVVVEEINMYEDRPEYKVSDILFEMLYDNHAIGRTVIGTKESVRSFSQQDLFKYKKTYYRAENTVLVFAGNVTPARALELSKKHFGTLDQGTGKKRAAVRQKQASVAIRSFFKATDQTHLTVSFRSLPLGHVKGAVVRVLATLLGRGMSSRLSLLLREELGVAYYAYASQESMADCGIFTINAGVDKARTQEVIERIALECNRLTREIVSAAELEKAKEYTIGTLRLGLELSDDIATFYGAQMVLGQRIKSPETIISEIKKVTAKDILMLARFLFVSKKANIALVGPHQEKRLLDTLKRALSSRL